MNTLNTLGFSVPELLLEHIKREVRDEGEVACSPHLTSAMIRDLVDLGYEVLRNWTSKQSCDIVRIRKLEQIKT